MSNSSGEPWLDGPSAPRIPYLVRPEEKTTFAGAFLGAISYGTSAHTPSPLSSPVFTQLRLLGIVIALFFQCMSALLDPINHARRDIKWSLVAHTILLFSCVTVFAGFQLLAPSISFIDNRGFPGSTVSLPGPIGYVSLLFEKPIFIVPGAFGFLSNWLTDGLLVSFTFHPIFQLSDAGVVPLAIPLLRYLF